MTDAPSVNRLARWWGEVQNPALRCARTGHVERSLERRVYLYPPTGIFASRYVADRGVETMTWCTRCNERLSSTIAKREGLNGLTLDSGRWDVLKAEGMLIAG